MNDVSGNGVQQIQIHNNLPIAQSTTMHTESRITADGSVVQSTVENSVMNSSLPPWVMANNDTV